MSEEIAQVISASLAEDGVIVKDQNAHAILMERGFGDKANGKLKLKHYEALYLLNIGKLQVTKGKKPISFDQLAAHALGRDPNGWTGFLIYRDLRSRGYVAKEGFGFGYDFRVYERGEYGTKPAKYVVFGLNEGMEMPLAELNKSVNEIRRMGKEAIVAVIERRGEVIYYRLAKARFKQNDRHPSQSD